MAVQSKPPAEDDAPAETSRSSSGASTHAMSNPLTPPSTPRRIPRSHTASSIPSSPAPLTSSQASSAPQKPSLTTSPLHVLRHLLNPPANPDYEHALNVATKRRGLYNLIQVPTRLERLLTLGQFICLDEFLTVFTFLPLRVLLFPLRGASPAAVIDLLHLTLLLTTTLALRAFDISWIYHNIRGQSVIKLYVVFNVIEIFDRLCSSFGVDILDSLGWTTASAVQFFSRIRQNPPTGVAARARALQGVGLVTRMLFDYVFAGVYVAVHAILLLTWLVTLNVAINTQNNALLTLLVSNNFVELKGSAFKSFKVQNIFQIACSDAVERFQLTVFLLIMLLVTTGDKKLFTTWGVIYGCEIVVDWIKHAFVSKFNRISHRAYYQFGLVICEDLTTKRQAVRSIGGSGASKRIGFVSLPLSALTARMAMPYVAHMPLWVVVTGWAGLLGFKTALCVGLVGHAWRKTRKGKMEEREGEDEALVKKLMSVERYDLISKNS